MLQKFDFLMPSIYFTITGFLATAFFFLKKEDKEVSFKVFAMYSIISLLVFGLIGLTGLMEIVRPVRFYLFFQAGLFILGLVHALTLYRLNSWTERESFLHEFAFTLYIAALGALAFLIVFSIFNVQGYALVYTTAFIAFLAPFLFIKTFDFLLMIPEEVYRKWYFPVGQAEIEIPDEMLDDNNIVVIGFRMQQTNDPESEFIKSRSKLPLKMELGQFFPVFLDQYNDRSPGSQIQFLDENKQPYGWNFYLEPKWWQFRTYLNPDLTIRENGIKENDIIVAERV